MNPPPRLYRLPAFCFAIAISTSSFACGPWFPKQFLAQGGEALLDPPEFFAEIELKLLAREYPTPFKAVRDQTPRRRNIERDLEDFDAAISDGSIHPRDPTAARAIHKRMRNVLTEICDLTPEDAAALPPEMYSGVEQQEFPSEFADYHSGVIAYARADHAAACAAWAKLLVRPENERRYRSVNAAFMIGLIGCLDNSDDASEWLAQARNLAKKGLHDPSGLAAASYLWEMDWNRAKGNLHRAAECGLLAVASGYPLRTIVEPSDETPEELAKFAHDPLLRRTHTALLLAAYGNSGEPDVAARKADFALWLNALEHADVDKFPGAERVGWLCYNAGDYAAAKKWLQRAPPDLPETLWLRGKLAARDGLPGASLRAYDEAARKIAARGEPAIEETTLLPWDDTPDSIFIGERGIVALGGGEFQTAFESFLHGEHWADAAYVAERLLPLRNLKSLVDKRPWRGEWDEFSEEKLYALSPVPAGVEEPNADEDSAFLPELRAIPRVVRTRQLRWLLARRLARSGHCGDALAYYPAKERTELARYLQALARSKDRALPSAERGIALWAAALEARYHGMELFGAETAPDWFMLYGGDFEADDPAACRTGSSVTLDDGKKFPLPAILHAGKAERLRLNETAVNPNKRFHYRYHAADLAWQAATLLPNNDPRLAEMLDLAGRWLAARDDFAADRFYQALEKRCAETEIGRRALEHRWFVDIENYSIPNRPEETGMRDYEKLSPELPATKRATLGS